MKRFSVLLLLLSIGGIANAERQTALSTVNTESSSDIHGPTTKPSPTPSPAPTPPAGERLTGIASITDLKERIEALNTLAKEEGIEAELGIQALELAAASRAALADQTYESGEKETAIELFRQAIAETPVPASDRLFAEILIRIPGSLLLKSEANAALETARLLEAHASSRVERLLALVTFHTSIENGADAVRLSEMASSIEPPTAAAFRALALANRLNFDLEAAESAQRRASELDPEANDIKRELADLLRANGKAKEALSLYQSILEADENNAQARAGSAMALYETGDRSEAEAELDRAIALSPENFSLLTAAAYWYATNGLPEKAIEFAEDSIEIQPRYVWSYIALARALSQKNRPLDAERALTRAKQYGNFPSLNYEIALVRMDAGFFREAAEEMSGVFEAANGEVSTRLGGRVGRTANSFPELLRDERRASIFAPNSISDTERAARLAALTAFYDKLNDEDSGSLDAESLGRFVSGDDKMRAHRELFAASLMLEKGLGTGKALELIASATDQTDTALTVSNPSAAVMASELYETRRIAFIRGEYLLVPDVPRQTLSAIMRGRIEELAGWALFREGNFADAAIRLQRAISVLPPDSAWWRSSKWRLGEALSADGKQDEALEHFIAGYDQTRPDYFKYTSIRNVYQQVNGSLEGLEARIGPNPFPEPETEKKEETATAETKAEEKAPEEQTPATPPIVSEERPTSPSEPETTTPVETKPEEKAEPRSAETAEAKPTEKPVERPAEVTDEKPAAKPENAEAPETPASEKPVLIEPAKPRSVFEPIVIEVGRKGGEAANKPEPKVEESTSRAEALKPVVDPVEKDADSVPEPTKKLEEKVEKPAEMPAPETAKPAEVANEEVSKETAESKTEAPETEPKPPVRPRIVPGVSIAEDAARCSIAVSQETITLMNNGGSIGLLVSFEGGDGTIEARSSNPDDVEVRREAAIAGLSGRAYFVIRSLTDRKGIFQILFSTSCSDKLIGVNVR